MRPIRSSGQIAADRRPGEHPQPLAQGGGQRPEYVREQEELDAAQAWLAHVEAGRIG